MMLAIGIGVIIGLLLYICAALRLGPFAWRCPLCLKKPGLDCGVWMYCMHCGTRQFPDGRIQTRYETDAKWR